MRNCDILIAGGGLAGTAAAIAAARRGHDVLLVEASNCLGGAACTCLVNPFMPYTTEDAHVRRRGLLGSHRSRQNF